MLDLLRDPTVQAWLTNLILAVIAAITGWRTARAAGDEADKKAASVMDKAVVAAVNALPGVKAGEPVSPGDLIELGAEAARHVLKVAPESASRLAERFGDRLKGRLAIEGSALQIDQVLAKVDSDAKRILTP